jgi:O-antigen/teichoic acid export membrane protein
MARSFDNLSNLIQMRLSGEGLRAKVFRGGVWLGSGSMIEQAARFGRSIVLTRLLAPEAFGTMAVIISASSVIHTITDMGVKEALIQNPRGTERHYMGAAWWLALGRAVVLASFICLVAPWMARFYGNLEITPLLRVATLSVIFDGAFSSRAYIAMKEMKFSKWAYINHGGGIIGTIATVLLSLFIRDVWALVLGLCAESAARCTLSFIICPYVPSLNWNREAFLDLTRFSRGLFGLAFLNLIFARADIFVLAKLYPAAQLGLYSMALYLAQTPVSYIMNLLGQTMLPTFSQIQTDNARIRRILFQVWSCIILFGLPALVFAVFCGRALLTIAFGSRYGATAPALIVACCVCLINLLNGQLTTVMYAKALPQLHRTCVLIMAIMMIIFTYPLAKWFGLPGGQISCLVAVLAGFAFQVNRLRRMIAFELSPYARPFLIALAMSVGVTAICLTTKFNAVLARPIPSVMLGIIGCLIAYGLSAVVVFRPVAKSAA